MFDITYVVSNFESGFLSFFSDVWKIITFRRHYTIIEVAFYHSVLKLQEVLSRESRNGIKNMSHGGTQDCPNYSSEESYN